MADEESGEDECQSVLSELALEDEAELELFLRSFSLERGELGRMDRDYLLYWTTMRHSDGFIVEPSEQEELDPQNDFMDFDGDFMELNDFLYPLSDSDI